MPICDVRWAFSVLPCIGLLVTSDFEPTTPSRNEQAVVTISRSVLSHLLVAAVFMIIGLLIGYVSYERIDEHVNDQQLVAAADVETIIQQAVGTAVASLPQIAADATPDPNMRYVVDTEGDPSLGPDDALITMVEFGDFQCGYCKRFNDETIGPLMERFGDDVRLVFRDYPVLGPGSQQSALAAECADDQGKFWEFHDRLYAAPDQLNLETYINYATDLEMDVSAFTDCYENEVLRDEIIEDFVSGQRLGVTGTPTFFINGKMLVGAQPLETFILMIETELAEIENDSTS